MPSNQGAWVAAVLGSALVSVLILLLVSWLLG